MRNDQWPEIPIGLSAHDQRGDEPLGGTIGDQASKGMSRLKFSIGWATELVASTFVGLLVLLFVFGIRPALGDGFTLGLPVACKIGVTCFLQNYFDADPGSAARDFQCGAATYDTHQGIDFRVPSFAQMILGIDVLASAPGTVRNVRDGMPDRLVDQEILAKLNGRECGNGVVIDHDDGWSTQYCHLRQGSVTVKPGLSVVAGSMLGKIGNSGLAQFPHLHFGVRKDGTPIDPFTGLAATEGCGSTEGRPLWNDTAVGIIHPPQSEVIDFGFAPVAVLPEDAITMTDINANPQADWPAIVAYVSAINLMAGDVQIITLTNSDGRVVTNEIEPLKRTKASYVTYTGLKRPEGGWRNGTYSGHYRLIRDGKAIIDVSISRELVGGG